MKAVTAQTESNNTENVFCVLGRVPMFIFAHSGVISLVHMFLCISDTLYNTHKRCTTENALKWSDVYVNVFSVLQSTPSGTIDINLSSCVLNRHKLRQSQIATNQESLPSQFVFCSNLLSRQWRNKLSPITPKTCSRYSGEYPSSLLTWIWKFAFLPILLLFHWYTCFNVYQS